MPVLAQPLTAEAFAPFGEVFDIGARRGLQRGVVQFVNGRAAAAPVLSLATLDPTAPPVRVEEMERHPQSTQTFVPSGVERYLVIVAPADEGGPDGSRVAAFVGSADQGISYHPGTWHHGMTALGGPGRFAVLLWEDGSPADTEWRPLPTPVTVDLPGPA